jgi:translocation and assembly module TamA
MELRHNVWGPVTAAVFADAGNVWEDDDGWRPLDLYPSSGFGLLFVTPVGPIRTDIAYQLRPNPYDQKRWAFHFSLGAPF